MEMKEVFTVNELPSGKSIWNKIGVAFVNKDNSLTVRLHALPCNASLIIRDKKEFDKRIENRDDNNATSDDIPF